MVFFTKAFNKPGSQPLWEGHELTKGWRGKTAKSPPSVYQIILFFLGTKLNNPCLPYSFPSPCPTFWKCETMGSGFGQWSVDWKHVALFHVYLNFLFSLFPPEDWQMKRILWRTASSLRTREPLWEKSRIKSKISNCKEQGICICCAKPLLGGSSPPTG